ncbi:GM21613 [Drosophila sechellia]|uniref:GM21613 n=1 Tax=Drosophila sechellia TaxID=7238 RepID=B4HS42_DROSE|nr:GM21613 [Drosophila sechellia]
MSSSAYISNGIGINYYTGNTQQVAYMQQVPATSSSISAGTSPAHQQQQLQQQQQPQQCGSSTSGSSINYSTTDPGLRRRLFAGIRPLSVFGRLRQQRSSQHRSISLPESNYDTLEHMRGSGDSNNHNRPLHNDTVMPMQKSFHLPASTSSNTTTTTATTPSTSYFGDAYNSIIDPIIAMSSRWNTSANPKSETTRPFGEPLMLLKSTESNPDESKGNRRVR